MDEAPSSLAKACEVPGQDTEEQAGSGAVRKLSSPEKAKLREMRTTCYFLIYRINKP